MRIGIGHSDGSMLVSGLTGFDALADLCTGNAWALVAGSVCIARQNPDFYLLRVLEPKISITLSARELQETINSLASDRRPTAAPFLARCGR